MKTSSCPSTSVFEEDLVRYLKTLGWAGAEEQIAGRGLHSSTFQLNVSAFYGTGGKFRGCSVGV